MKPPVFNHQQYTDLEADYMILKAENEKLNRLLINMQEECDIADAANTALHGALEEAERREKAAVECIEEIEFSLANSRFSAAWAEIRKWRGARKEQNDG